jgi:hypothetical protein
MNLDAVYTLLANLGFKKRAGNVFTIELAPGVIGWLGLNRATRHRAPGEVEINPVIGVRFQEVERLVAECRGEKFHTYQPPTISIPLGYLMPQNKYKAWVFAPEGAEHVAAEMVTAIAGYGVPFMRSVTDLAELCRRFEDRPGFEHQLVYRRPVAALLAGDLMRARTLLNEATATIGTRTDAAALEFKKFAECLRSRL